MGSKTKLAVGLDLGSSSTRVLICAVEEDSVRFLGHGEAPVQAWNKSRLTDQDALTESISFALHEAELRAQASPTSAVIGLGGSAVGVNSRGLYEFGRKRDIEPDDLRYAIELAGRVRLEEDREVIQICPQDFILDGRAGYHNPKGIVCARLEANIHVITASSQEHQGLISAVHRAHLAVDESIFEAVAAAYACVMAEDRARGVALIDIGAHSTHLALYEGDALLLAASIPLGGEHFTRDISWLLKVNYEDAELLKREYGWAISGIVSDHSMIELPSPEGRAPREAPRGQMNQILEARAEDIFERVYAEVLRVGMEQSLLEGAVLTGGGSLLPGMCDVAERILNCQVKKGLALGIDRWPADLDTPVWATAAGLAMYSARLKLKRDWKRASPGVAGLVAK